MTFACGSTMTLSSKGGEAVERVSKVADEEEFDKYIKEMGELYEVARVKKGRMPVVYRSFTPAASFGGIFKKGKGRQQAGELLVSLCQALKAFHDRGYSHGCLAPQYVIVDDKGKVHLCGVGFGSFISMTYSYTGRGEDSMYAPLDDLFGAEDVDKRQGDIFSLGCVIYYMFTGEHAFRADGLIMVIEKKKKGVKVPDDVPARYKHLIEWCWKPAGERPSVDEVLEYLLK